MTTRNQILRARLLASVASGLLAALVAGSAYAADTVVIPGLPATTNVTAGIGINNLLENQAPVDASIENAHGRIGITGIQTGTGNTVSLNTIAAAARGNYAAAAIADLLLLEQTGAAALNYATNGGLVTSAVTDSDLSISLDGFQSGVASNVGNTISASTALNTSETSVEGALPNGFSSTTLGSSRTGANPLETQGTILASSMQQAGGTGHAATSDGNQVLLTLTTPGSNTVIASPELSDNRVAAAFRGNTSTTGIELAAGGAPTFQGSAVTANVQTTNAFGAFGTAVVTDTLVEASVSSTSPAAANTLNGSLVVSGNRIVASAIANEAAGASAATAGNRIYLADGLSFDGPGPAIAGSSIGYSSFPGGSNVSADLVAYNSQNNVGNNGTLLRARMSGNTISAEVDALSGSIDLSDNAIAAEAAGNAASNEIAMGTGAATFAGTAASASEQVNTGLNIAAENTGGTISATAGKPSVGGADNSPITVAGNSVSSTGFGNRVSQNVSLEANSLAIGNGIAVLSGGTSPDGNVSANSAVSVTTLQRNVRSNVSASNTQSTITLNSLDASNVASQFAISDNTQEAVAVGNSSDNGIALKGTTVGTGAGIANVQMSDADSSVSASLTMPRAAIAAQDLQGSSAALTGNLQRAIANGSSAANQMTVDATSITLLPNGGPPSPSNVASVLTLQPGGGGASLHAGGLPTTRTAYGILNDQTNLSDVTATASNALLQIAISGLVLSGSSVNNDGNAIVAAAYGTDAANAIALNATSISTGLAGGFASVASATNAQTSTGDITATVSSSNPATQGIVTTAGTVSDSTISTSDNAIQAIAFGNRLTDNSVKVTATNIATAANPALARGQATAAPGPGGSTYVADAAFTAQNAQSALGTIVASLGTLGGRVPQIGTVINGALTNGTVNSDGNQLSATATANSAASSVVLNANNLATSAAVQNAQSSSARVVAQSGLAGFAGGPPEGGVTITTAGAITSSTLSVDGNSSAAAATGNSAANRLIASANTIAVGSGQINAQAGQLPGNTVGARGDYSLANTQSAEGQGISAQIFGKFGIRPSFGSTITGSGISVSDNRQIGSAVANTATNELALTGNSVSAGAALSSSQTGSVALTASSLLHLFAPGAAVGSSIAIKDNSNIALSVMNDVVNTLSVAATNLAPVGQPAHVALGTALGGLNATGDRVLANSQTTAPGATVNASATTILSNTDNVPAPGSGLSNSSLTVSGNSTLAEASANRATNTISLDATAMLGGNAGMTNAQSNAAAVTADARTDATITLFGGGPGGALSQSTLSLENNSTTALARGNTATNVLNATAGAEYRNAVAGPTLTNATTNGNQAVSATMGILNRQSNTGAVTATSDNSVYRVALNGSMSAGTVNVGGNRIAAEASGNSAINQITLTGLNGQSPSAAVNNRQTNTGAITASVSGASIAMTGTGLTGGSSIGVRSNSVTASAVGNSVTSVVRTK